MRKKVMIKDRKEDLPDVSRGFDFDEFTIYSLALFDQEKSLEAAE